ncbi:hypothetical protein GPALN_012037 [Globodera pallida]|nr:hypothetical protein GPALN_012037 [Globodera pallida]
MSDCVTFMDNSYGDDKSVGQKSLAAAPPPSPPQLDAKFPLCDLPAGADFPELGKGAGGGLVPRLVAVFVPPLSLGVIKLGSDSFWDGSAAVDDKKIFLKKHRAHCERRSSAKKVNLLKKMVKRIHLIGQRMWEHFLCGTLGDIEPAHKAFNH